MAEFGIDDASLLAELAEEADLSIDAYLKLEDEWDFSFQDWVALVEQVEANAPTDPWWRFAAVVGHLAESDRGDALAGRVCIRCAKPGPTEIVGTSTLGPLLADPDCAKDYVPYSELESCRAPELLAHFYARESLRGVTVVYRCYDDDDTLLYVGQTQHPWTRGEWLPYDSEYRGPRRRYQRRAARITYEVHSSRREALQAERDAIRAENPIHNIVRYEKTPIATEPATYSGPRGHPIAAAMPTAFIDDRMGSIRTLTRVRQQTLDALAAAEAAERADAVAWRNALCQGWTEDELHKIGFDSPRRRAPGRPRRDVAQPR